MPSRVALRRNAPAGGLAARGGTVATRVLCQARSRCARGRSRNRFVGTLAVAALLLVGLGQSPGAGAALPPGFQESVVFSGLSNPTALRFSPDGRIFVAEKNGRIKVFDGLGDPTPTLFADLSTNVYNFWDRGLLGLALDPDFPADPWVYVLYTYDHELGSLAPAPRWGTPGVLSDPCPTPPGPTADGCVVSGRLSRLQASGNVMVGSEQVLIEDWCQQYPSHSTGSLAFGADGALYVSGGDGASFNFADWGQDGSPVNPCGDPDPPDDVGTAQSPPTAQGGALRSQDLRTSGDSVSLDGAILRVDPATGAGLPDNPLAMSPDANARRIIAYGLRNPFRINVRPGTNEVWVGDVGWTTWEEVNRVVDPLGAGIDDVENFGWPCYEGQGRQPGYDGANLTVCETLYTQGEVTGPHFTYNHSSKVVTGETCPTGSSSVAGISFYQGGPFPASYDGALFFADYSRDCIWAMKAGAGGIPASGLLETFVAPAANPVDVQISPAGDLFYADFDGGTIRRIQFVSANQPPVAVATANPTSGPAPLTVSFDGSGSSDPDGDAITHAWDLDGDGLYDDSTAIQPTHTYTQSGSVTVRLRVTDDAGASSVSDPIVITAGNTPPTATINAPSGSLTWRVGDVINFSGSGTDTQDGSLPASALSWSLILNHCPSNCHSHPLQDFVGVASGSFTAPDHEYPSNLELVLTVTDSGGLTSTARVTLQPQTVNLTFTTSPSGLQLVLNGASAATPFTRTVIAGSTSTISAPSPQTLNGGNYAFSSWSDGGAQTHVITASSAATYNAVYLAPPTPTNTIPPALNGPTMVGKTIKTSNGTWTGSTPMSFTYQWLRCDASGGACVAIAGATANKYQLTSADAGRRVRVTVTATNSAGSGSATSAASAVIRQRGG
jgi:glucose/arabinose dehydrogenase/PKD repeat protein